jgi:Holliday junction DNA helicase RuvB
LLKRVRDYVDVRGNGKLTLESAAGALQLLQIDPLGLDYNDIRIIEAIIDKFSGGPVGIKTLAMTTSEEESTIEDVYEPYLLRIGFIKRTHKGREATPLAYKHLGRNKINTLL